MKSPGRSWHARVLAALLAGALIATACGDDEPDTTQPAATTDDATAATTTDDTPEATTTDDATAATTDDTPEATTTDDATAATTDDTPEATTTDDATDTTQEAAMGPLAWQGHPCIPAAAAEQVAPQPGKVVYLVGSLRGEDWFYPKVAFGSLANLMPMVEYLLCRDPATSEIVAGTGELAETWSHNDDFTVFEFKLREGIQFHDGWGELTTDDVGFSWDMIGADDSGNSSAAVFAKGTFEAIDKYQFRITWPDPNPGFAADLTEVAPQFPINSKAYIEAVGEEEARKNPIGTGPFKFTEHQPGISVTFEALTDHWRIIPGVQTLEIRQVPENNTRKELLKAGEAHITFINHGEIPEILDAGLQVVSLPNSRQPTVYLTGQYLEPQYDPDDTPPWVTGNEDQEILIREGLSRLIDRQEILDFLFYGKGTLDHNCVQSWWPHYVGFDTDCVPDPYDVEAGLALLAQAGFEDPGDLVILMDLTEHPTQTYNDDVALAVTQQWQTAGVTVETQVTDYGTFESRSTDRVAVEAFVYPPLPVSDACFFLGFISLSTSRVSYTGESEEIERLITECRAAILPADKEALAQELFEYMEARQLGLPVTYIDQVTAFAPDLVWDRNQVAPFLHAFDSIRFE